MRKIKTPEQRRYDRCYKALQLMTKERDAAVANCHAQIVQIRNEEYEWRLKTMLAAEALRRSNVVNDEVPKALPSIEVLGDGESACEKN